VSFDGFVDESSLKLPCLMVRVLMAKTASLFKIELLSTVSLKAWRSSSSSVKDSSGDLNFIFQRSISIFLKARKTKYLVDISGEAEGAAYHPVQRGNHCSKIPAPGTPQPFVSISTSFAAASCIAFSLSSLRAS